MTKPPFWFKLLAVVALLWNIAGLLAVAADMSQSPADIATLPLDQQALYVGRPMWSVAASAVAVLGGTIGSIGLLLRKGWAQALFWLSLLGVVFQDIGIYVAAGAAKSSSAVPWVLQGLVLLIAIGLIVLSRSRHATTAVAGAAA
jgi:hypothetical protein